RLQARVVDLNLLHLFVGNHAVLRAAPAAKMAAFSTLYMGAGTPAFKAGRLAGAGKSWEAASARSAGGTASRRYILTTFATVRPQTEPQRGLNCAL
ncbi:MAG TPA: hypothetical protein DEO49_03995, partial [Sutterella sp.]|nr:hypothetical protein [Sutterella sp.]